MKTSSDHYSQRFYLIKIRDFCRNEKISLIEKQFYEIAAEWRYVEKWADDLLNNLDKGNIELIEDFKNIQVIEHFKRILPDGTGTKRLERLLKLLEIKLKK